MQPETALRIRPKRRGACENERSEILEFAGQPDAFEGQLRQHQVGECESMSSRVRNLLIRRGGEPSPSSRRHLPQGWTREEEKSRRHDLILASGGEIRSYAARAAYLTFPGVYGARGWVVSDQDRILFTHNRKIGIVRPR